MNLKNIEWNKTIYNEYIKYLESLENLKYREFNSKIVSTKLKMIGIKVPILKKIAKEILKGNYLEFLKIKNKNCYYEEVLIYGFVLSNSDEKYLDKYLVDFINRIDNWAICDMFSSSMKIINKKSGKYWIYFTNLIDLNNEFQTRLSIVNMLNYYLNDKYIDRVLNIVSNIKTDYYYINMAISWLLSVAIINYKEKVIDILKEKTLPKFVQNKTISKINDSFKINKELKNDLKQYKIL